MDKQSLIYLIGPSGAGKTWVCNQLNPDIYHVIEYDKVRNNNFLDAIKNAPADKQVVAVLCFKVSTFKKILEKDFDLRTIVVCPSYEQLERNIQARGGKITKYLARRHTRFVNFGNTAEYIGTSADVLKYIQRSNQDNGDKFNIIGVLAETPGIYKITNIKNNKYYVGQAVNLKRRCWSHMRKLLRGNHPNPHLQAAYNLDGFRSFTFEVLESLPLDKNLLTQREQYWLDINNPDESYNMASPTDGHLGMKRPYSTREKLKLTRLGTTLSEIHKQRIGSSLREFHINNPDFGRLQTRVMVQKAADLHRDKPLSEFHRLAIQATMKKVIVDGGLKEIKRLQRISRIGAQRASEMIHIKAKQRLNLTTEEETEYERMYRQRKSKKEIFNDRKRFIRALAKKRNTPIKGI